VLVTNIISQKEHILHVKKIIIFFIIIIKYLVLSINIYVTETIHDSRVQNFAVVFIIHGILMVFV
jgi:hypothetical protein